jgi:hypothetical protein
MLKDATWVNLSDTEVRPIPNIKPEFLIVHLWTRFDHSDID